MSDSHLADVPTVLELVALLIVAGIFLLAPASRHRLAVLLGALIPPLLVHAALFTVRLTAAPESSIDLATGRVWLLPFAPLIAALLTGAILAFVPRPKSVWLRVAVGFVAAPLKMALLIGVSWL